MDSSWVGYNSQMNLGWVQVGQVRIDRWGQDGLRLDWLEQLDGARLGRLEYLDEARMGSSWVDYNSQINLGWVQVGQVRIDRWGQDGFRLDWLEQLGRARIGWFEQLDGAKLGSGWVCQNRLMKIGQFQVGQVRIVRWSQDGFRLGRLE